VNTSIFLLLPSTVMSLGSFVFFSNDYFFSKSANNKLSEYLKRCLLECFPDLRPYTKAYASKQACHLASQRADRRKEELALRGSVEDCIQEAGAAPCE
jgi:hypothetical protein